MTYKEWKEEFDRIVMDLEGLKAKEFCKVQLLPVYYKKRFSPLETYEAIKDVQRGSI